MTDNGCGWLAMTHPPKPCTLHAGHDGAHQYRTETHDRFENAHGLHPDWLPERRPWCAECCVPLSSCGCPAAEAELDKMRAMHLEGMGIE